MDGIPIGRAGQLLEFSTESSPAPFVTRCPLSMEGIADVYKQGTLGATVGTQLQQF